MNRVFSLRGGRVHLGATPVLSDVDLDIDEGEFVVLLGGNGSGKTTLIRALLGLIPLKSGHLELFGVPFTRFKAWSRIGYVPQRFSATSGVPATVEEVVLSGRVTQARRLRNYSAADRTAAFRALEQVALTHRAEDPVEDLSGGQQQRVLIARALAGEPDVLVLDEPVSGVDIRHQELFAQTVADLQATNRTILLVAHELGALQPLAGRAVVLESGRIAYDGPPLDEHFHIEHVHHHPGIERHRPRGTP